MSKNRRPHKYNARRRKWVQNHYQEQKFYSTRGVFGYKNVYFWLLLGGREAGKSYSVLDRFLRDWKFKGIPFYWLRLTDRIAQDMLQNNAAKMIDADLCRKYELDLVVKGCEVFNKEKDGSLTKLAEVRGISNFYNQKGTASFDNQWKKGYNICLDECQREVGEAVRFDISYALVNTLENYVRSTRKKLRIVFICNYTETVSDVLNLFNFIPEKFGRYHLAKKKAVLDYLPPSRKYLRRRQGAAANILMPEASTFTNKKVFDKSLLVPKGIRLWRPQMIIDFGDARERYVVWRTTEQVDCTKPMIIAMWNGEKLPEGNVVAMRPYIEGLAYNKKKAQAVINMFDARQWKFKDLITQQRFTVSCAKIRKSK